MPKLHRFATLHLNQLSKNRRRPVSAVLRIFACGFSLLACLLPCLPAFAVPPAGTPPVERHEPSLDVYPQNFAIARDDRGILYVGNTNGLLQFDGERWKLLRLPNHELVRSLHVKGRRVYVGGYSSFGYAEEDASGQLSYTELSTPERLPAGVRNFADIWDVLAAPECVYFRALHDTFCWQPDTGVLKHWRHEARFGTVTHHKGRTLLQFRGEGFRVREGDNWKPLAGTSQLTALVHEVMPLADGALLAFAVDGRWWRMQLNGDAAVVTPAAVPADMPAAGRVHRAAVLKDGSIAMTMEDGHVAVVDGALKVVQKFRLDPGFLPGVVALGDGFMVAANQALYRVTWPSAWRMIDRGDGATGTLYGYSNWNNQSYLFSSAGILRWQRGADGVERFLPVSWNPGMAYSFHALDNQRALVASAHSLFVVSGERAQQVGKEILYPRLIQPSRFNASQMFIGTENGLRRARVSASGVQLAPGLKELNAARVTTLEETAPGEVWFGTNRSGLWRLRGDAADASGAWKEVTRFDAKHGLRIGPIARTEVARLPDGSFIASTSEGLFKLEGERFVATDLDGLAALKPATETFRIVVSPNGDQWAYAPSRLVYRPKGGAWRVEDIRTLKRGAIYSHHFDANGIITLVTTHALLVNGGKPAQADPSPGMLLRSVRRVEPGGAVTHLPLAPGAPLRLPAGDYSLTFDFALPDFGRGSARGYQGYLDGVEKQYYDWGPQPSYTYSALVPGTYHLRMRGRDTFSRVSELTPYTLIIEPPWYRSVWARVLGGLIAVMLGAALVQLFARKRTARLELERTRLEGLVEDRTRELATANRRLEQIAHLDGLTGLPNRRRLDEVLAAVWERCAESQRAMSVLVIDVDHFKQFNDRLGHLAGDETLRSLADLLRRSMRRTEDVVARYGGEEFLVVLPGADANMAASLAEALRASVEGAGLGVTISVGVASVVPSALGDVVQLVAAGDRALYTAKNGGRNRVVIDSAAVKAQHEAVNNPAQED